MKKSVRVLILICLLFSLNIFAADNPAVTSANNESKNWNFRFGPVGLLIGLVNMDLDYKINDKITIGPTLSFWNLKIFDISIKATALGVQGRYFLNKVYEDSAYGLIRLQFAKVKAEIEDQGVLYTGEGTGGSLAIGAGYHWFWDSSFNLNLGGGVNTSTTKVEVKDSTGTAYKDEPKADGGGFLEFTLGWVF